MADMKRMGRGVLIAVLLLVAASGTGCRYAVYRAEDLVETFDIGLMFSKRPGLALYGCGVSVICLGVSKFDGVVVGMGGGQIGIIQHSNECWGMGVVGQERMNWGRGRRYEQPQGWAAIMGQKRLPSLAYFPACNHYLHLLHIGLVANARYGEMIDFILGFAGLDPAGDDGRRKGNRYLF